MSDQKNVTRRALTVDQVAASYPVGVTKIYELLKTGQLRAKKSGRRTMIDAESVEAWYSSLPEYQPRS